MRILGVDPGASGAMALLVGESLEAVVDMPLLHIKRGKTKKAELDGERLGALIRSLAPDVAYFEHVGGIPGQSAPAAFNFGRATGAVEYVLKAYGVRVVPVPPAVWKKTKQLDKKDKSASRDLACRFWPEMAPSFARVKDDGRAEAALIAEYGRIQENVKMEKNDVFQ